MILKRNVLGSDLQQLYSHGQGAATYIININSTSCSHLTARAGLRPVFILSKDVKIVGGEGTKEIPFELGL